MKPIGDLPPMEYEEILLSEEREAARVAVLS